MKPDFSDNRGKCEPPKSRVTRPGQISKIEKPENAILGNIRKKKHFSHIYYSSSA